jgi:hypothetical protein
LEPFSFFFLPKGIPPKEADDAAQESLAHFQNWWLQARFKSSVNAIDQNDNSAADTAHLTSPGNSSSKRQKSSKVSFNTTMAAEIH